MCVGNVLMFVSATRMHCNVRRKIRRELGGKRVASLEDHRTNKKHDKNIDIKRNERYENNNSMIMMITIR
jgi:hypothetical protein